MTVPTISGARDTANVNQTLRRIDMADRILKLQPDAGPLTVFSKMLSKKATINPKFQWAEDDLEDRVDATTGTATNVATSIPVGKDIWNVDDLALNTRTNEIVLVTAGLSGGNITATRGYGTVAGTAMLGSDELVKVGAASQEHALSRVARTSNPAVKLNYTEIFRRSVEFSDTWAKSDQFVQDYDPDYIRGLQGIEHLRDIENAFLLGQPKEDTSGAHPRRTTGGALSFISTNQTAVGGTMTEASFYAALRPAFRYGSGEKLMLASPLVVDVLSAYARGKIQVADQSRTTYGVKIVDIVSPHGTLHVTKHWALGDTSKYAGTALILDLEQIRYRYLANSNGSRDTALLRNRQENDRDGEKDEWITEAGLSFGLEKTHARIDGVTG